MWPRCSSASPGAPAKHPAPDAPIRFRVTRAGAKSPFIDASVEVRLQHQSDGCGGGGFTRGLAFTKEDGLLATASS